MHPQIALQAHRLLLQRPGPVCNRLPPRHRSWYTPSVAGPRSGSLGSGGSSPNRTWPGDRTWTNVRWRSSKHLRASGKDSMRARTDRRDGYPHHYGRARGNSRRRFSTTGITTTIHHHRLFLDLPFARTFVAIVS
uniref:Uncharacterized protein n=1 Tax=Anopheles coluzzii TaxID=1518534 RepID=A0A8W7PFE5_ANOCL